MNLTGAAGPPAPTPSLAAAAGYPPQPFMALLRTGTPLDPNKQLGLMRETARLSLTNLTDDEITAIYDYLKTLPASGVAVR